MKIVYLVHQFYPMHYTGTEKFVLNMATMMQKAGHKVKVITYSFYEEEFYDCKTETLLMREFSYNGIPILALRHKNIPYDDIHTSLENEDLSNVAKKLIEREMPDIVHVGHPMRVTELIKATQLLGIPYIFTLTDFFLICPKVTLMTTMGNLCSGASNGKACYKYCPELPINYVTHRLQVAKKMLFGAEKVIAPSQFVANIFEKEFEGLKVTEISHGIKYSNVKRNNKIYHKGDNITFGYAGTLRPHKGAHILMEAFSKLNSDKAILKVYGSGDPSYIKEMKINANQNAKIEFCDSYTERQVGDIFSQFDAFIVPSQWHETYSLVLHEALACQVPVIATDAGAMTEKIMDGLNGFTFKLGDVEQLTEYLRRIIEDPLILNVLKKNMKKMFIPTVEQEAYIYEGVYQKHCKKMKKLLLEGENMDTHIGHVDIVNEFEVTGWVADTNEKHKQCFVDIWINGEKVSTLKGDLFRKDLIEAGLGDGYKSFFFNPRAFLMDGLNYLRVVFSGTEKVLPNGMKEILFTKKQLLADQESTSRVEENVVQSPTTNTTISKDSQSLKSLSQLSRIRWRGSEEDVGLTWGKLMTGESFVQSVQSHYTFSSNEMICELGPGYGRLLKTILDKNIQFQSYTGVELSEERVRKLKENFKDNRVKFIHDDILEFKLNQCADIVLCSSTFEHLFPDFSGGLKNVAKNLNDNGIVCIDFYMQDDDMMYKQQIFEDSGTFVRVYSRDEIEEVFHACGFVNLKIHSIVLGEGVYGLVRRIFVYAQKK